LTRADLAAVAFAGAAALDENAGRVAETHEAAWTFIGR